MTDSKPPSAEGIANAARAASGKKGLPPVHLWNPDFCGDLDMRIARDGTWFYLGTPIGRKELVRLFSTILRKDDDKYFLVTPVEKVGIKVDDAPFVAVDFEATGSGLDQSLTFETNKNIETTISSAKPPIFWKEKEATKQQIYKWKPKNIKKLIYLLSETELQVKKNVNNSINLVADFILHQSSSTTNN